MVYSRESLQASLRAATGCCAILTEYFKSDNNSGYIQCIIPIHVYIDWLVHYELDNDYFVIHFEKDGYESLICTIKEFIKDNDDFVEIASPAGNRFGCKFMHSFAPTDINEITRTFKGLFELINPIVEEYLSRLCIRLNLAKILYKLKKAESNKLPHQINLIDELHANENAHSRILRTLLQYKSNTEFTILKSFIELCVKNKEFDLSKIIEPMITAEKERIDCLIEEHDHSYAIIVENKIKGADDKDKQLERYYRRVKAHGVPGEHIFIVYLTKDGKDGGNPTDISLTDWLKAELKYEDESHNRLIALNYRNDILPWLKESILPEIKIKEELLYSAIVQYIDHLEGMMGKRKREQPIYDIMNKKLEEELKLKGSSTDKWIILDNALKEVDELKNVLVNNKEKYANSIINDFEELAESLFDTENQITTANFFKIFIPGVSHFVHFEWRELSVQKLCCGGDVKFVLHTEYDEAKKAVELAVNNAFKKALEDTGFVFCYNYDESPIRTVISQVVSWQNAFNSADDTKNKISNIKKILKVYENADKLKSYIQDNKIRTCNENLPYILENLRQKTSNVDIDEPWLGYDLFIVFNKGLSREIAIESHYGIDEYDKLEYRIMITVWKQENWTPYESKLKEKLDITSIDKDSEPDRCWAHLKPIKVQSAEDPSVEEIVKRLLDVYNIVKEIVDSLRLTSSF